MAQCNFPLPNGRGRCRVQVAAGTCPHHGTKGPGAAGPIQVDTTVETGIQTFFGDDTTVITVGGEYGMFGLSWLEDPDGAAARVGDFNEIVDVDAFDIDDRLFRSVYVGFTRQTAMAAARNAEVLDWAGEMFQRHQRGDWGDLDDDDKTANDAATRTGERLMSSYSISDDFHARYDLSASKLWIITDAAFEDGDRDRTTILFPHEY